LRVPDLPRFSAKSALAVFTSILGEKIISIRAFLLSMLFSALITTLSIAVGMFFTQGLEHVHRGSLFYMTEYPLSIYAINFAFDIMTLVLAIACLKKVVSSNSIRAFSWSILIIIQAFVLAVACYLTLYFVWYRDVTGIALADIVIGLSIAKQSIQYALSSLFLLPGKIHVITHHTMWGFYACSTFIPLFIYWGVMVFSFVTKAVLSLFRLFIIRILSRILDNDPDLEDEKHYFYPFTTLGVILTVFGASITLLMVLKNSQLEAK
jgi:hypothetical protein